MCSNGGDAKNDRDARDFRHEGMADDWICGASTFDGRAVYFDGEFVSVFGGVVAAGAAEERCILGWCGKTMDSGEDLGRRKHDG